MEFHAELLDHGLIDPAWEYWMPDPDIAELIEESSGTKADQADELFRHSVGIHFGNGNPNRGQRTRLAASKPVKDSPPERGPANCNGCHKVFMPKRSEQVYCCSACQPRAGRPRTRIDGRLPQAKVCPECAGEFFPWRPQQVCCGKRCSAKRGRRIKGKA
jgi:hypothetical protein